MGRNPLDPSKELSQCYILLDLSGFGVLLTWLIRLIFAPQLAACPNETYIHSVFCIIGIMCKITGLLGSTGTVLQQEFYLRMSTPTVNGVQTFKYTEPSSFPVLGIIYTSFRPQDGRANHVVHK